MNWFAASAAGVVAGVVATGAQLLLWWLASFSVTDMLLRDTRLAAAILMGPSVLPPPAAFAWDIFLVATLIHFTLSAMYGLLEGMLITRLQLPAALTGAAFGLALYAVNMYGFTLLFPWFEASRDWITASAHVTFGVCAAILYKRWKDMAGIR